MKTYGKESKRGRAKVRYCCGNKYIGARAWALHMKTHRKRQKKELENKECEKDEGTLKIETVKKISESRKKNDILKTYGTAIRYPIKKENFS